MTLKDLKAIEDQIATELALTYCPFYRAHYKIGPQWSYYTALANVELDRLR